MPEPKVGIFWINPVSLNLIVHSEAISSVKTEVGFKTGSFDHCDIWADVQKKYPVLTGREYDEIARGRVVFDTGKNKYFVYSNKEVLRNFKSEISKAFHLPKSKTVFLEDLHYTLNNIDELGDP